MHQNDNPPSCHITTMTLIITILSPRQIYIIFHSCPQPIQILAQAPPRIKLHFTDTWTERGSTQRCNELTAYRENKTVTSESIQNYTVAAIDCSVDRRGCPSVRIPQQPPTVTWQRCNRFISDITEGSTAVVGEMVPGIWSMLFVVIDY
jgi:hypothetical protein